MEHYADIYQRAVARKGNKQSLELLLSKPLDENHLLQVSDNDWLEEFTRKVFQSGFYWSVINKKWSGFREVFWEFDVQKLLMMPPEMLEQKSADERIVRNYKKVKTIIENATMIAFSTKDTGKDFNQFIAEWPSDNIVELWLWLKKHGSRLGGNTGPYTLRAMGKDTFLLSNDVVTYLKVNNIIEGGVHSKKSLRAAQEFFNAMQGQCGLSLQEISQTIAYSVGDNHIL